jgi:hypothetical protein
MAVALFVRSIATFVICRSVEEGNTLPTNEEFIIVSVYS